jgi:HSP20 family protein
MGKMVKIRISPEMCSYVDRDQSTLNVEITLPGVKKGDIELKMHEDSFNLRAPKEEIEYVTTGVFCCPVKPNEAKATYDNGLLKIKVPFKTPMAPSITVPIS